MAVREVDVAIAGGGPAGAAAACMLARSGLHVLLADTGASQAFKVGESLPPSARHLLRELGALDRILADGHRASHGTLAFWGDDAPHANDFLFQLHGHGLQLDRTRFDAALRAHAYAAGAQVVCEARLSVHEHGDGRGPHRLLLREKDSATPVESRWLIDATGRPATLARQFGAIKVEHDALLAFHMRLASDADSDHDGRTFVEAVEHGWWYSVLLPSRERLVAFLSDADLVDRRNLLTSGGLWRALRDAPHLHALCSGHGYAPASSPQGADASGGHLDRAASAHDDTGGWLAVGDAALAFDPLSSKGISNALYTGLRAAQVILDSDRGDTGAIVRYADHVLDIHRTYRTQLGAFYQMATRWRGNPFWRRRSRDGRGTPTLHRAQRSAISSEPAPTRTVIQHHDSRTEGNPR